MKKIFAIILSLVMTMSLSVPAFAAETDNVTSTEEGSNSASKDVTASYTPSSTDNTPAIITGVSITVDGTTYTSGNVTITPDTQSITLTVTGTNLNNATEDNKVDYAAGRGDPLSFDGFKYDPTGTTATLSLEASAFADSTNYEIVYFNNYSDVDDRISVHTGIFVTYDNGIAEADKAVITGVSITVDNITYTSGQTAIITPETRSIVLNVIGTNLHNGTINNSVYYANGNTIHISTTKYSWTFNDDNSVATLDISGDISHFEDTTTALEITYSNDGGSNRTGSGVYVIYQSGTVSETVSVDITWGAMSFTYDDTVAEGTTEENGWTCEDGANQITVSNRGTVNVNAAVAYTPADDYSAITGKFQNENKAEVTNANIGASTSYDFYLILSGKPEQALNGATIGSVTVTITKNTASE